MTRNLRSTTGKMLAAFAALTATPVLAQAEEPSGDEPAISVDASIEVVSDYRFRGSCQTKIAGGVGR